MLLFTYSILTEIEVKNMWIVKTKKGKFKFVDNYKNPLTQKYQEVSVTFGKNNNQVKKKAQMLLDDKIRERLTELQTGNTDITFDKLAQKYLAVAKEQPAYNTWYRKKTTLDKISQDWGINLIAKNITSQFINKYLDNLLYGQQQYANETVNSYKSCISVVFDLGVRYGYISKNPVDQVKISWRSQSQKKREEIENKYLEDNEYAKILQYCDKNNRPDLKDLFIWMYNTGMRCGEVAALQKKNILQDKDGHYFARVEGSLITIRNEKDKNKRHRKTRNAKTFAGDRDVYLPPEAKEIALRHCKNKKPNDYIFRNEWPTSDGYFINSKINKVLKTIAKKEKIHKKLVTHIFRHTHVSKLAEQGWPLNVIQHCVGHGNSRITRNIYLHITKKVKDAAIDRLQDFPNSQTILQENRNKPKLKVVNKK